MNILRASPDLPDILVCKINLLLVVKVLHALAVVCVVGHAVVIDGIVL